MCERSNDIDSADFDEMIFDVCVGQKMPSIKTSAYLPESNKIESIDLSSYKDKWKVLFFYPADFTFVCPTELEELADNYAELQSEGAEVFSVSTDTAFAHKAWHDTSAAIKKIKFPMLADPTGNIASMCGTYIEDGDDKGLSLRGTIVIDPDNIVRVIEIHDNSIGRSVKELIRKIKAAKFVREHNGQVCPASWEPGKNTLTPGVDLVGKI